MKINKYPDGSSYINSTKLGLRVFKVNTYEDLWHLNQFVDAFHSEHNTLASKIRPNIILPNLIDAQADRRFNKGESSGLKLVCKFLNSLDANFYIFHPHNAEVIESLMDNVKIINNSSFIKEVLLDLDISKTNEGGFGFNSDNLILMSSDAGGFKPLMNLCDEINWKGQTYSASKHRKYDGNETRLTQFIDLNDFQEKDILIIDDISVYGGTFKGLSKLLKERNCGKLYLAVSHITVQNLGDDPVTNYFDNVFTTNSKFDNCFYENKKGGATSPKNLKIIKLF